MTSTFLKRYYFDDRKLLQRTFLEFARALGTDRMIAVTGSMATEGAGYQSWKSFRADYLASAAALLRLREADQLGIPRGLHKRSVGIIEGLLEEYRDSNSKLDTRVALSAAKETLRVIDEHRRPAPDWRKDDDWDPTPAPGRWRPPALRKILKGLKRSDLPDPPDDMTLAGALAALAAADFRRPKGVRTDGADVTRRLLDDLGILRFVTLNYDFEIERATMARDEPAGDDTSSFKLISSMIKSGRIRRDDRVAHRLSCLLPDGTSVDSDVFDRERPDRLLEFAIGSAEADQHILHLHGRACTPSTMVVGTRDYDQLYRQTHPSRLPFREGLRVLFAGNPIVFVGLGMTEAEINETLQTFVSDNPYRYQAPIFLIWNTWGNKADKAERDRQKRVARLDWLMRLGVFVIFDDELREVADEAEQLRLLDKMKRAPRGLRERKLIHLASTIRALGQEVDVIRDRTREVGERFRDTRSRIEASLHPAGGKGADSTGELRRIRLWAPLPSPVPKGERPVMPGPSPDAVKVPREKPIVLVGRSGVGKGELARAIFEGGFASEIPDRMLVNASFCYDTDSLADALVRFLGKLHMTNGGPLSKRNPQLSREELLATPGVFECTPGLVVMNGIDRFFTTEGRPLSVEVDQLFRKLAQSEEGGGNVRFVLLGTERARRYFEKIGGCDIRDVPEPAARRAVGSAHSGSRYLDSLTADLPAPPRAARARIDAARRSSTSSHAYRQAAVGTILTHSSLAKFGVDPELALEILRTLAFIGMPVEAVVLLHAPSVRVALMPGAQDPATTPPATRLEDAAAKLTDTISKLAKARIVFEFSRFQDYPGSEDPQANPLWRRFGLHRTILSELRERHGVPLSRSKRATAFNMSLYTAQPVDSDTPEAGTHDELALLIDRLIGSYRDEPADGERPPAPAKDCDDILAAEAEKCRPPLSESSETLRRLIAPASVACLRAALAVIRGYYSTTTLLSIDRGQRLASPDRDGALLEHAERLERLLRGYRRISRFRDAWVKQGLGQNPPPADGEAGERDLRTARMTSIGPEPFYPDEIVWLHNELGTIRLSQGDLYGARNAFDRALEINRSSVEFSHPSHNWRRIMLNCVMLEIERGRLSEAEDHLRQIERTVDQRSVPTAPMNGESRAASIVQIFARPGEHDEEHSRIHPNYLHEEILTVALVRSMTGLIEHLRGHLRTAKISYSDGIRILRRLGEHRAYALFQRYYAQLVRSLGDVEAYRIEIGLAVAAAESVRQLDFAYPARMIQAEPIAGGQRNEYLRQAIAAQEYSMLTDNHRVRVDAAARLARAKLDSGDYEMALDHATDALTTATRFGMTLRKINLRILIGQVLIRRGDRRSGTALIDAAIEQADRIDYQRAVALAQRVRSTEEIAF